VGEVSVEMGGLVREKMDEVFHSLQTLCGCFFNGLLFLHFRQPHQLHCHFRFLFLSGSLRMPWKWKSKRADFGGRLEEEEQDIMGDNLKSHKI